MDSSRQRDDVARGGIQRNRRFTYALASVVFLMIGLAVFWKIRGAGMYQRYRDNKLMDQAETLLKTEKVLDAATAARKLFREDPSNLRAMRVLASVAEKLRVRDAIMWRQRIAEFEPLRSENWLDLVQTAIGYNDMLIARDALNRFPEKAREENFFYNQAAGAVFFGLGDKVRSEHHFSKAAQLQPTNEFAQLNLARVRIIGTDDRWRSQARETLAKILPGSPNFPTAMGILARDSLSRGDIKAAGEFTTRIATATNAPISERVLHLTFLKQTSSPEFDGYLTLLQKESLNTPMDATQVLTWMNEAGMASAALAWVKKQPPDFFKEPSTGLAIAELYASMRDWLGLRNWVRGADWGIAQSFRFAYEARAVYNLPRSEQTPAEVDALWKKALAAAGELPSQIEALARVAAAWEMLPQWEACWWKIADGNASQENALMVLLRNYLLTDNTYGQYRVARKLLRVNPKNLNAKNNTVYFGLLLQDSAPDIISMAEELYSAAPTDPNYASTYALAIFRQKSDRVREAIEKLEQLPEKDLESGSIALTFGYLLAHAGERERARLYLRRAEGTRMLPEELKMLDEAKALARLRE